MPDVREQTALDDLGNVVVSKPLHFHTRADAGAWSQWCAERRSVATSDGVDWDDPRLVVDLTGPVATVGLKAPKRESALAPGGIPARLVTTAAVAIVVLNVLDIITTRLALMDGATEGNPLANLFVHNLPLFVAIKLLLPGMVALRMWVIRDRATPMLLAAMWWVVGVYSMVITINAIHVLTQ